MASLTGFFNVLEEAHRIDVQNRRNNLRANRYYSRSMNMNCEEFQRNYRVTKELFSILVSDLTPLMRKPTRRSDISIECKILATLSFYATGSYQRIVGSSRSIAISQQSVSKSIREVTRALNDEVILYKYLKFPGTTEERNLIKRRFYEKFHIPGVIGCIDGTQVAIIRPKEDEQLFFNRKHYHSRNVQIICDSDMNILSVNAAWGGSTHDSFIFNRHPIKRLLSGLIRRGEILYLLGDSGYPQREYLMTPILNAEAGSAEEYYTQKHCSARNSVERTIGLLKARWRCLLRHRVLHYDPHAATRIINACCVLHNLCNRHNCPIPNLTNIDIDTLPIPPNHPSSPSLSTSSRNDELRRGQEARRRLVQSLWRNRRQR